MRQRMRQVRRAKRRADACIGLRESRDRYSYRIGHVTCISGAPNCVYKEAHTSTGFIYQKQFLNIYQRLTNSSGIMEPPPAKRKVSAVWDHFDLLSENKTIKQMVAKKYEEEKERVKMEVQQAVAVSITADMWTSVNMEAYLALTCHYINENLQLCTSVLGVKYFPQSHTADNLAQVKRGMMEDWAITNKVKCFVTDAAPNMIASTRQLQIRHSICIAHSLNLLVRKSCDQVPTLTSIRHKARNIVTYFRSSTTAKEKLAQVQQQMGRPTLKLINEVPTRWNSTYEMLSRLHDEREPVWVSLASLNTVLTPLTADEYTIIGETLLVLAPFHQATVELSEERRVSGSKVIPMMKMLYFALERSALTLHTQAAIHLHEHLKHRVTDTASNLESLSVMTLATLLDPRFKSLGFRSSSKFNEAVTRLRSECASVIGRTNEPQPGPSSQQLSAPTSGMLFSIICMLFFGNHVLKCHFFSDNLWQDFDIEVGRQTTSATADAIQEVQRYLAEGNIARSQDPLKYWDNHKSLYPNLFNLALQFLCTPASSVPCERVFSAAGEIVSKKRNRLNFKTLEKLIFLNKNL
ncbi:E3 SUMO-protein ligase ZBED1-like isoform X1 [Betta splendens]|nr:E3 SUMO-protein ligase ZBED1-like isoform X1 [Betta splendens]